VPYGIRAMLGGTYMFVGRNDRTVDWCRTQMARADDTHMCARTGLVISLAVTGCRDEAMAVADGLIAAAEATRNPWALSYALLAYGLAFRGPRAVQGLEALRRGLRLAQDSGNRGTESHLLGVLGRLESEHGEPLAALDHLTQAIRNYHDSGNSSNIGGPLAILAAFFDRIGRYEPAATIADYALNPLTASAFPEVGTAIAHLRDVLGDETNESLSHKGEAMTTAEMATYAYDQIDQARTALEQLR
jgi:tetratricopeptide (TPR) repeat protein